MIGGYYKDRRTIIITNLIVLIGAVEFISYFAQTFFGNYYKATNYTLISGFAALCYLVLNIVFFVYYKMSIIKNDSGFKDWREHNLSTCRWMSFISCVFSFKIMRLLYSKLYGFNNFAAQFANHQTLIKPLTSFTILHILLCYVPIITADIIGLIELEWGTQLYINMIETLILTIIMIILQMIEFCRLKQILGIADDPYRPVFNDSMVTPDDAFDKKQREDALKSIIATVKGNRGIVVNNSIDDLLEKFGPRRCMSMEDLSRDQEEDPRKYWSYPGTPSKYKENDGFNFCADDRYGQPDNVYAEGKPANPVTRNVKQYDADSQTLDSEF